MGPIPLQCTSGALQLRTTAHLPSGQVRLSDMYRYHLRLKLLSFNFDAFIMTADSTAANTISTNTLLAIDYSLHGPVLSALVPGLILSHLLSSKVSTF